MKGSKMPCNHYGSCNKVKCFFRCTVWEKLNKLFGAWTPYIVGLGAILLLLCLFGFVPACSPTRSLSSAAGSFLPPSTLGDGGAGAAAGSFSWAGGLMMILGAVGLLTGLANKKAAFTCLGAGIGVCAFPLLLAYVGQGVLQWTAGGLALCGVAIVAAMAYRRWKRLLNDKR